MTNRKTLFLYEELMLLALRDEKGTLAAGNLYEYAIGGALLADLLLRGRVAVTGGSKTIVDVVATERIGDPLLDECLDRLRVAGRRASAQRWVSRFAGLRRLKQRVAQQLCRRGILREDEDRVLLIFTRTIYPEVDPGPERELIARMRAAIFTESRDVEPRTAALVSRHPDQRRVWSPSMTHRNTWATNASLRGWCWTSMR